MPKPLKELLDRDARGNYQGVQVTEMARRLQALDEFDWERLATPFQGLTSVKERHTWRAAGMTARDEIRRILDGETTP